MRHPQYVRTGSLWAVADPVTGKLTPAEQTEADIDLPTITVVTIMKLRTEISGLLMRMFRLSTQMRHRDRQKQNMASEACTVLLPRSPFQC